MSILVLTSEPDLTADLVIRELNARRRVELFRCDPGDFPQGVTLTARLADRWTGQLRTRERRVALESIRSVYYRRPSRFKFSQDMSAIDRQFAAAEAKMGFGGVIAALSGCAWVNHPFHVAGAEYKPLQLVCALEHGLSVPDTLITNDPEEATAFAHETAAKVVYKPLTHGPARDGGRPVVLYSSLVDADECADPAIRSTAHMFQAWVPKRHDVRVNVIAEQCLAVAIHVPRTSPGYVDWRSDYPNNEYEPVEVPRRVQLGIHAMMRRLGLVFGAFDFVVTPDGEWFFLEVNPNGEWGWLEGRAGSIACAIADVLEDAEN